MKNINAFFLSILTTSITLQSMARLENSRTQTSSKKLISTQKSMPSSWISYLASYFSNKQAQAPSLAFKQTSFAERKKNIDIKRKNYADIEKIISNIKPTLSKESQQELASILLTIQDQSAKVISCYTDLKKKLSKKISIQELKDKMQKCTVKSDHLYSLNFNLNNTKLKFEKKEQNLNNAQSSFWNQKETEVKEKLVKHIKPYTDKANAAITAYTSAKKQYDKTAKDASLEEIMQQLVTATAMKLDEINPVIKKLTREQKLKYENGTWQIEQSSLSTLADLRKFLITFKSANIKKSKQIYDSPIVTSAIEEWSLDDIRKRWIRIILTHESELEYNEELLKYINEVFQSIMILIKAFHMHHPSPDSSQEPVDQKTYDQIFNWISEHITKPLQNINTTNAPQEISNIIPYHNPPLITKFNKEIEQNGELKIDQKIRDIIVNNYITTSKQMEQELFKKWEKTTIKFIKKYHSGINSATEKTKFTNQMKDYILDYTTNTFPILLSKVDAIKQIINDDVITAGSPESAIAIFIPKINRLLDFKE